MEAPAKRAGASKTQPRPPTPQWMCDKTLVAAVLPREREMLPWLYPFMMGAAIVTGVLVGRRTGKPLGLTRGQRLGLALGAFCGGMIGAKLPFAILDWDGFLSGAAWLDSGKTLVLGLVG